MPFHSTGEERELRPSLFLKVNPGESVLISSMELIDLRVSALHAIMLGCMLRLLSLWM